MLLGTRGASFLRNLLTGKAVSRPNIPGQGVITTGEKIIRRGERIFNAVSSFR